MKTRSLTGAALFAMLPLAGAMAQGTLSPVIPAADTAQAAETAIGHSDRHRPFFYWLFGDLSETAPVATAVGSTTPVNATPVSPTPVGATSAAPAIAAPASAMKTGTGIGTR